MSDDGEGWPQPRAGIRPQHQPTVRGPRQRQLRHRPTQPGDINAARVQIGVEDTVTTAVFGREHQADQGMSRPVGARCLATSSPPAPTAMIPLQTAMLMITDQASVSDNHAAPGAPGADRASDQNLQGQAEPGSSDRLTSSSSTCLPPRLPAGAHAAVFKKRSVFDSDRRPVGLAEDGEITLELST